MAQQFQLLETIKRNEVSTASTKTYIYMYISDCMRWPI